MVKPKLKKPKKVSLIINHRGHKQQIMGNLILITMPDEKGICEIMIEDNKGEFTTFTNRQVLDYQEIKVKQINTIKIKQ